MSAVYYDDYESNNPGGSAGAAWTNTNTDKGVLVITLDGTGGTGDDVFLRVVNGQYTFATDANFTNLVTVTTPFYTAPSQAPFNGGFPGSGGGTIGTSIGANFTHDYRLQTLDPNTTGTTVVPGVVAQFTSKFDTIMVRTSGLTDGIDSPSFTIVGGSHNVTKTLIVDLRDDNGDPISDAVISIGSPVAVALDTADGVVGAVNGGEIAGDSDFSGFFGPTGSGIFTPTRTAGTVYLAAESILVNAQVSSQVNLQLLSGIGADNLATGDTPSGIIVNTAMSVAGGDVTIQSLGTAMRVNAGGSIGGVGGGSAANLSVFLTDADLIVAGKINALNQSYFISASNLTPALATSHKITTKSASTGLQTGLISGNDVVAYLANSAPNATLDGIFDVQTSINRIRVETANALRYDITVTNNKSLTIDAVTASSGDIAFKTTAGTIDLNAAITSIGAFTLQSFDSLTVDSSIETASNVTLESTNGSVTLTAAIATHEAATDKGQVFVRAKNDVTINSLVQAEYDGVSVTAQNGKIDTAFNFRALPTSQIKGTSATLVAATDITLGTDVAALSAKTTSALAGSDITISDFRDDGTFLAVAAVSTVNGTVTLESVQDMVLLSVKAGGAGDIVATSTRGDIELSVVVAEGSAVTLNAVEYQDDDPEGTVLHAGYISGLAPTAAEISWTAAGVVTDLDDPTTPNTDLYRNIPTISARLEATGDIEFTSNNAVTLKNIIATDGSVNVTSASGSINAQAIEARSNGALANVTLLAGLGSVTVGAISAESNTVDITAGQGILDDGVATSAIVSDNVTLRAAADGAPSDIGTAVNRITVESAVVGGTVNLTIEQADTGLFPDAVEPTSVYVGIGATSASSLNLTAVALNLVDASAPSGASDIVVRSIAVSDTVGQVNVTSGRDLFVGVVQVAAGGFEEGSQITLGAGRWIENDDPTDPTQTVLEADILSLQAATFDGSFSLENVDLINRFKASATAGGGTGTFGFDRDTALILDGVTTLSGNISISNTGAGDLLVGAGGVTAGSPTSGNSATLTAAAGIDGPTDTGEVQGTIFAGSLVNLTAAEDIVALTRAGQLAATSTTGVIDIAQTGDVKLGTIKTDALASSVTLAVTGTILAGTGTLTTSNASVTATTGMTLRTNVDTLSASTTSGNLTVTEADGLDVGADGIRAPGGTAKITLTKGNLFGGGSPIQANTVAVQLLEAGNDIDIDTIASSISATTAAGDITVENEGNFSIASTGVSAGGGANNVSLASIKGAITSPTGSGTIRAVDLTLSAVTGIAATTNVSTITAASTGGNIALAQSGKSVTLSSVVASNGGVTVTNNDHVTVTSVQAIGSSKNVAITTTGAGKNITLAVDSITASGDLVTLTASGGIDGDAVALPADPAAPNPVPDVNTNIVAGNIVLVGTGDVTATVKATNVAARALGTDADTKVASKLDLTVLGSKAKPFFLNSTTASQLTASGDLSLTVLDSEQPFPTPTVDDPAVYDPANPVDIVVVTKPVSGTNNIALNTYGTVTFVVSNTSGTAQGSLPQSLIDAGAVVNNLGGGAGVAFSSTISSPIQLTSTLNLTTKTSLDGTRRINPTTGTYSVGRLIDIDGSRLAASQSSGFNFTPAADGSKISGFAFWGFARTSAASPRKAAVRVNGDPAGITDVEISNNFFGMRSNGGTSTNDYGILATNAQNLTISGNTIVKSLVAGISLGANVSDARIQGNTIGTNASRVPNMGNTVGIELLSTGAGNVIGLPDGSTDATLGNFVSFSSGQGIRVNGTDASAGTATTIRGNEVLLNGTGVLVDGASKNVVVAGNTVTRNTGDGIRINGTSSTVTVGGAAVADRNYIGTNPRLALGLGNGSNGVSLTSTGANLTVTGNTILGNGVTIVAAVPDNNSGVKLSGTAASTQVTNNTINGNRGPGVLAMSGAKGTLTGNTITSNLNNGVTVKSAANLTIGSLASQAVDATIRANANTINSNSRYGVEVLATAFAQIVGNSMASNTLGGIVNANLTAPTITSATFGRTTQVLTVSFSGLVANQVVSVYAGTPQGRNYLGRFVATGTTGTFSIARSALPASVQGQVYAGALVTGTRSSTGASGQTSGFATAVTVRSV